MKEPILAKATDMFLNYGFKSITMDDLAKELGISKKTIYSHYQNKTKLVEASVMRVFQEISQGIDQICALEKNPIEELYEIKKFAMHHLKNEKSSPQYQLNKYYPKIYSTLKKKQFEVMHECVRQNVNKGIKEGFYRANLSDEFISRIYFMGMISLRDEDLFPRGLFSSPDLMDQYLEYHLRGIVTPEGRKVLNLLINSKDD